MQAEWRSTTIGKFCPFIYGKKLLKLKRCPGNIKVYGANGIIGTHHEPLVNEPGIIIGARGTVGTVHYSNGPFWPIDTAFYVTESSHRDLKFTYYLLKSIDIKRMQSGSIIPGLSRNHVHDVEIVVPDLITQTRIANFLDCINGCIDDRSNLLIDEISTLGTLRDTLLPRLMSGQLKIPSDNGVC